MQFKAKIIKIGNSKGIRIPNNVITSLNLELNNVITLEVITSKGNNSVNIKNDDHIRNFKAGKIINKDRLVETKKEAGHNPFDICPKHKCFYKSCGC